MTGRHEEWIGLPKPKGIIVAAASSPDAVVIPAGGFRVPGTSEAHACTTEKPSGMAWVHNNGVTCPGDCL